MARGTSTKTVEVEEAEVDQSNQVHIRLKKAQMLLNPAIGLELNALVNKTTAILDKTKLEDIQKQKLQTLIGAGQIEVYDPSLPEPMMIEEYQLDLSDSPQYQFLHARETTEKQVLAYVKQILNTPRVAKIPLKVLYALETTGQNKALKPRVAVVDAIVQALEVIGISEKEGRELTPVEKDKLIDAIEKHARVEKGVNADFTNEADEVLTSVQ
jgi:hypothetical protein